MPCLACGSKRIAQVTGKSSDCSNIQIDNQEHDGYIPDDMPFGGGDYIKFKVCLECGHMIGDWPCPKTELELDNDE